MNRDKILDILREILERHGKPTDCAEDTELASVGFRSLDFSEMAIRVETASGKQLVFDASPLREIRTIADVVDFFEKSCGTTGNSAKQ